MPTGDEWSVESTCWNSAETRMVLVWDSGDGMVFACRMVVTMPIRIEEDDMTSTELMPEYR